MPYKKVLVIINPASGQRSPEKTQKLVEEALTAHRLEYEIRLTGGAGDALTWARQAPGEGFDLVMVSGGDGTVVEALSGLMQSGCAAPLAALPGGTASLIGKALDIPDSEREALEVALGGKAVRLDVGYIKERERYFALIAGAGWDARLIEDAPRGLKKRLGFAAYVLTGMKNLFSLRRTTVTLELDGKTEHLRAHTVMIANIGRLGRSGLTLGPDIWPHDGKLDLIVMTATSLPGLVKLSWRILNKNFRNYRELKYFKVSQTVRLSSSQPLPVQIDGEGAGETPLTIEVVPGGALVIAPASYNILPPEDGWQ
jgi:YegS/Rv2252/BmrU family lipid kinase